MTEPTPTGPSPRRRHDPLAALRQPSFALFSASRFFAGTASMTLTAAVAWQVYDVSGSALQLGMVGLARFLPALALSLIAGAVADSFDRRRIALLVQAAVFACAVMFFVATAGGWITLPLIYAIVFLVAVAQAFEAPARQALLPAVVTREAFPNAIAVSSGIQQLAFVTGPALAGGLIAVSGLAAAYAALVVLTAVSGPLLLLVRARPVEGPRGAVTLAAVREGVQFVLHRQVLLGAMTLDMFAVIFGGATALLPIYARDILDVGAFGYGLLYASLDVGAFLVAITLVALPPIDRTGRALLIAVGLYGLGTIVFGLARSFPLALAAYTFIGMADQLSVVMRQTTIQLATPDELRGRVTSVNMLFIGSSNQLGSFESGLVAAATNATFAVVSGGIGCLGVLAAVAAKMPAFRTYRVSAAHSPPPLAGPLHANPTEPPATAASPPAGS